MSSGEHFNGKTIMGWAFQRGAGCSWGLRRSRIRSDSLSQCLPRTVFFGRRCVLQQPQSRDRLPHPEVLSTRGLTTRTMAVGHGWIEPAGWQDRPPFRRSGRRLLGYARCPDLARVLERWPNQRFVYVCCRREPGRLARSRWTSRSESGEDRRGTSQYAYSLPGIV
jgi:hypothetical protein